jgi:hypothetical protein
MQSTGQTGGRHFPQPEQSSGTITTSSPWLKMAPNCGGQCRRHVSQLMHVAMSMRNGEFCHFSLRTRRLTRSARVAPSADAVIDLTVPAMPERCMLKPRESSPSQGSGWGQDGDVSCSVWLGVLPLALLLLCGELGALVVSPGRPRSPHAMRNYHTSHLGDCRGHCGQPQTAGTETFRRW